MLVVDRAGKVFERDESANQYAAAAVVGGVWQYGSASQFQKADPNTYGGCFRSWFYDYVLGTRGPETEAMRRGRKMLHEPIEAYYETGLEAFTPLIMPGRRYLYNPGSDLHIEREIARPLDAPATLQVEWKGKIVEAQTAIVLADAPLKVAGAAFVGQIDLMHERGYYINEACDLVPEPHPNTIEVNDWKSTSSRDYAKSAPQLMTETIQMPAYGKWTITVAPAAEWVRLSHTYFLTKGKADAWKSTGLVHRDDIERRWEYVEGLGRSISDIARETDPERVPGNKKSCLAYGRGCAHHPKNGGSCSVGRYTSTASIFGAAGAAALKGETTSQEIIPIMSLLKKTTEGAALLVPTLPQTTPPTVTPQNTAQHVGVNLTLGGAPSLADLLSAEAAARGLPAVAPQPQTPSTLAPEVVEAFDIVEASRMGWPVLVGDAADAYVKWKHIRTGVRMAYQPGAALAGSGMLGGLKAHDTVATVIATAGDLRQHAASKAPAVITAEPPVSTVPAPITTISVQHITPAISALPPDVPTSGQTGPIALPVEGVEMPATTTPPALDVVSIAVQPTTAAPLGVTTGTAPVEAKPEKPARKPRTPKSKPTDAPTTDAPSEQSGDDESAQPFELYIDCVPSQPFEMLDQYIPAWNASIVAAMRQRGYHFDIPDCRVPPKDCQALAFGAWEATLEAVVRESIGDGKLPRARYVLFTAGSKVNSIIVSAMIAARTKVGEDYTGDLVLDGYTRGVR